MWYNVYWLITQGGIFTKTRIFGFIKNITDDEQIDIDVLGIKQKNTLSYPHEKDIYKIKILSNDKVIIQRNNDLINSTLIFEKGKNSSSFYQIKKEDITLEINLKTKYLKISDNLIDIAYTIIDSNTDYQYKIEMSDNNEYKS